MQCCAVSLTGFFGGEAFLVGRGGVPAQRPPVLGEEPPLLPPPPPGGGVPARPRGDRLDPGLAPPLSGLDLLRGERAEDSRTAVKGGERR